MARLREPRPAPGAPGGMPGRFRYEDWADEAADGPAPDGCEEMWHKIRAFGRYLRTKHGLTPGGASVERAQRDAEEVGVNG